MFFHLFSDFNSLTEGEKRKTEKRKREKRKREKRKDVFYCVSKRKTKHVHLNQRDIYICFFERSTYKTVEQGPLKNPLLQRSDKQKQSQLFQNSGNHQNLQQFEEHLFKKHG